MKNQKNETLERKIDKQKALRKQAGGEKMENNKSYRDDKTKSCM